MAINKTSKRGRPCNSEIKSRKWEYKKWVKSILDKKTKKINKIKSGKISKTASLEDVQEGINFLIAVTNSPTPYVIEDALNHLDVLTEKLIVLRLIVEKVKQAELLEEGNAYED